MLDDLGTSLQASDFADSSDVLSIPLDAKFEVFVRVEPLWIHAKLSHCLFSLGFDLAGHLLEFDNYKLSRFQWREANHDVDDVKRGPPHRYILPFGSQPIIALQRSRAPDDASSRNHRAQAIDAQRVEFTILGIG